MGELNYQAEATRALKITSGRMFEAHRGAFLWHEPTDLMLLFGNDGFGKYHLEFLRAKCAEEGVTIWADVTSKDKEFPEEDDYSFVMLIRHNDADMASEWVWQSWANINNAKDIDGIQRRIAQS